MLNISKEQNFDLELTMTDSQPVGLATYREPPKKAEPYHAIQRKAVSMGVSTRETSVPQIDIKTGISKIGRQKSSESVKLLMAETYTLYLKTHGYHWNVEGPHFQQLHALFMEQYTEMWAVVDDLAERIRALGFYAPSSYGQMAALSLLEEERGTPDWRKMVSVLARDHEHLADTARFALRVADEFGDDGTADVVTPRITLHEKTAWILRSTAK